MNLLIPKEELVALCTRQLANMFVFDPKEATPLKQNIDIALERIEHCFSFAKNKYYSKEGVTYFSPFHSGQYTIFLYYLSRSIWEKDNNESLADRVYYLNKMLNCLDLYYQIKLPDVFFLDHPVGSVMGRANYSNYFSFTQNCTVGNNHGVYPSFGEFVSLFANSTIVGNCKVGKNCIIAADTFIRDENIPDNSVVFGSSPHLTVKTKTQSYMDDYFRDRWQLC